MNQAGEKFFSCSALPCDQDICVVTGCHCRLAHKLPLASKGLIVLILAMLPFCMNFVTFISKGIVHMLMNYAYFFF